MEPGQSFDAGRSFEPGHADMRLLSPFLPGAVSVPAPVLLNLALSGQTSPLQHPSLLLLSLSRL